MWLGRWIDRRRQSPLKVGERFRVQVAILIATTLVILELSFKERPSEFRLRERMTETDLILRARLKDSCVTTAQFRRADLTSERDLHTRKWFDYRFMSPSEATAIFRAEYEKVYRSSHAHNIDTAEAERKYGTRRGVPEDYRAEFTSFWRARQFADLLGVPYDIFLQAAYQTLLRGSFQRIPYINQLFGKHRERVAVAAIQYWEEYCGSRFVFSALPHYRQESLQGLAAQVAHQDWVLEQLKTRNDHAIGRACFTLRILPEERAKAAFGEERLENARACAAEEVPEVHESWGPRRLLPSCAMLAGALDTSSPECLTCKVASFCTRAEASVLGSVTSVTGVADPEDERRRKLGRVRTQRCRAKAKLAAVAKSSAVAKTL